MAHQPFNLKNVLLWAAIALGGFTFQACSNDDDYSTVDGQNPTISLTSDLIHAEPGRTFNITGKISDADGIKSIRLKNEGMLLDKTINLLDIYKDSLLHEYNLDYAYTPADDWTDNSSFPLEVTVEDVVGKVSTANITIKGDGDFTFPVFTVAPSNKVNVMKEDPIFLLNVAVSDNKSLKKLVIDIPGINKHDEVTLSGTEYEYSEEYTFPSEDADYEMSIKVYDSMDNMTEQKSTIIVSDLVDFEKMYLADVNSAAELTSDVYGVPMLVDHVGEFQYRARYYNQKPGTGIRFIPQKTDFGPLCFGVDEKTGLLTRKASDAKPIILEKVGYYEINFNIITGEYKVEEYTPTTKKMTLNGSTTIDFNDGSGAQPAQICLAGKGYLPEGAGEWTTNQNSGAFILNQDENNPYRLYREMNLKAGDEIEFTISQTHWWGWWPEPYWRFDGSDENEANKLNGGDNMKAVKVPATGKYLFEFDYALLRSRIIPIK